jgi:hypothetical protein
MSLKFEVTVRHRSEEVPNLGDRTQRFWNPIARSYKDNDAYIPALEAKLEQDFPDQLKNRLRHEFEDRLLRRGPIPEWYQFSELRMKRDTDREILGQWAAQVERIEWAVNKVFFRVKISGYSSLKLSVEAAPEAALAELFGDVDAVELFLEAAMPYCFGSTYNDDIPKMLEFDVKRQGSDSTSFAHLAAATPNSSPRPVADKSEKIWRIANYSLVLPVLLTVYIFFQGLHQLSEIKRVDDRSQIVDLQMKMLQADAERMRILSPSPPCPQVAATTRTDTK